MRSISQELLEKQVYQAIISMSEELPSSFLGLLKEAERKEKDERAKHILEQILENADIAKEKHIPLCQDTGIMVIFLEVGRDIHFDYDPYPIINQAVSKAYQDGYLRKSVVNDPFERVNTKDNTPAIIHTKLVDGSKLRIKLLMKGAGSENMSVLKMLLPNAGKEGVKQLVLDTIKEAGGKACPPLLVGIGIGGDLEKAALLAKEALTFDFINQTAYEKELMAAINELKIGPMGLGGNTTCLGVKVNIYPCHIASLPVAINLQCHAARHKEIEI